MQSDVTAWRASAMPVLSALALPPFAFETTRSVDVAVAPCERRRARERAVGRAVVDDDDLERRILAARAGCAARQDHRLLVVDRHDDRDRRLAASRRSPAPRLSMWCR